MIHNEDLKITVNDEGGLIMKNAKTIKTYSAIHEECHKHHHEGIFFAFSNEQFEQGMKEIAHLREGDEKVVRIGGGGFGWRKYIHKMIDYHESIDKRIAEQCDPQEVYCYEYNNHECMYGYDGDEPAYELVYNIFGEEGLKAITRRCRAKYSYNGFLLHMNGEFEVPNLTLDGEAPEHVYFSYEDGRAYCLKNGALCPVMQGDKQYIAPDESWWQFTAKYKDGKLCKFHVD